MNGKPRRFRKVMIFAPAALLLLIVSLQLFQPTQVAPVKSTGSIRVGTFNLNFSNPNPLSGAQIAIDNDVDIALFLEYSGMNLDTDHLLQCGFVDAASRPVRSPYGLALLCRKELRAEAEVLPCPADSPCPLPFVAARILTRQGYFSVLGIHPPPPISGCSGTTDDVLLAFAGMVEFGRMNCDVGPARAGDPVVVLGDFNTLPGADELDVLKSRGLVDSQHHVDSTPGPTWKPMILLPAMARIDYIFVSESLLIKSSSLLSIPGSDHHGIVTDVALSDT